MLLIFFISLFLFSIAPPSLTIFFKKKDGSEIPLILKCPSQQKEEFIHRLQQTKEYAKTIKFKGKISPLTTSKIPSGSFYRPLPVKLKNRWYQKSFPDQRTFIYLQEKSKDEVFSESSSFNTGIPQPVGHLYKKNPNEGLEVDQYYKNRVKKFLKNPEKDILKIYPAKSFETIVYSSFQLLVEILENTPQIWKMCSIQIKIKLLIIHSRNLLLANYFSEAKKIAFFIIHTFSKLIDKKQKKILNHIIEGWTDIVVQNIDDVTIPHNLANLSGDYKLRWMNLRKYKNILPITYTRKDKNILQFFKETDTFEYFNHSLKQQLTEDFSNDLLSVIKSLCLQGIVQCDPLPINFLINSKTLPHHLVVADFNTVFSEVEPQDTLMNLNLIKMFYAYKTIHFPISPSKEFTLRHQLAYKRPPSSIAQDIGRMETVLKKTNCLANIFWSEDASYLTHFYFLLLHLLMQYLSEPDHLKLDLFLLYLSHPSSKLHKPFNYEEKTKDYYLQVNRSQKFRPYLLFMAFLNKLQVQNEAPSFNMIENFHKFCLLLYQNPHLNLYEYLIQINETAWFATHKAGNTTLVENKVLFNSIPHMLELSKQAVHQKKTLSIKSIPPTLQDQIEINSQLKAIKAIKKSS